MRKRIRKQKAFTIVELLIVIVVTGILAAIAIVGFSGIQKRAQTSAVSSSLSSAVKMIKVYQVKNGNYPTALADAGVTDGATTYQYSSTATTYCVTGTQGTTSLYVSDTQSTPTTGGCAGHGQGGVAAVTNLVPNPSIEGGVTTPNRPYGGTGSVDNTTAVVGSNSMLITANGSVYTGGIWTAPVSGPGTYTCSISLKSSPNRSVNVSLRQETAAAVYINEGIGTKAVSLTSAWQRVTVTGSASAANLGILAIQFNTNTAVSGDRFWADATMCTPGSTVHGYADGSSPNWVWNGTANASSSTGPSL